MFGFGGSVKIYYCPTPVNMRKSFDGLAGAVEEYIKQDPESGHVFAFFSRNKKLVKVYARKGDRVPGNDASGSRIASSCFGGNKEISALRNVRFIGRDVPWERCNTVSAP